MRILWVADGPWTPTSYAQQTATFAPRLRDLGHDVAIAAIYGINGTGLMWNGLKVYPPDQASGRDAEVITGHAKDHDADLIITLLDTWSLNTKHLIDAGFPVANWMPVDMAPLGAPDRARLAEGGIPIAVSTHGRQMLQDAGFNPLFVPHGIDCQVFKPGDKAAARAQIGIPQDAFVIGINAVNKDTNRKAFGEQFAAFAAFREQHPDALMFVHANPRPVPGIGYDLTALTDDLGITGSVRWSNRHKYETGAYTAADLATWYSALDVLSACSYGEGFCLPLIEAQACGIPVITTDGNSMTAQCGAGWLVPGQRYWNIPFRASWSLPIISEITAAYEQAFAISGGLAGQAREFALGYDADRVTRHYWVPVLANLEQRINTPRVSVCFASRGRPDALQATVERLLDYADRPGRVEVIVAVDPDDLATQQVTLPPQARLWVAPERYGYAGLHHYLNALVKQARGDWIMWFNDDMIIQTRGWDSAIARSPQGVLWPYANHISQANLAPIWPRKWCEAAGCASPTMHMDIWLQRVAEMLGCHHRVPIRIIHDRFDVTGNPARDDTTYAEGRGLLGPVGMTPDWEPAIAEHFLPYLAAVRSVL